MNKITDIIISVLILIIFIALTYNYPYKEVLQCNNNQCTVKKHYIFFFKNNVYHFNRNDQIQITSYQNSSVRKGYNSYYHNLINLTDSHTIFENGSGYFDRIDSILTKVKSENPKIKITKYWF